MNDTGQTGERHIWLAALFLVSFFGARFVVGSSPPPALIVEMRSGTSGSAQLFYTTGKGRRQTEAASQVPVSSSADFAVLRFPLPAQTLRTLRLDPIDGPGTISVRRAYVVNSSGDVNREFALSDLLALSQIPVRLDRPGETTFVTAPHANEPMLKIALSSPLALSPSLVQRVAPVALALLAALGITAAAAAIVFGVRRAGGPVAVLRQVVRGSVSAGEFCFRALERPAMVPRLLLGYLVAVALAVPVLAVPSSRTGEYTIAVTMQSMVPSDLQVFYDLGLGFSERNSSDVLLRPSHEPQEYRLTIPAGRYFRLRIDPGRLPGRYIITDVRILRREGPVVVPVTALIPAYQISILEKSPGRLVTESPPGSSDPQLVYALGRPLDLPGSPVARWIESTPVSLLLTLLWAFGLGVVWLIERIPVPRPDARVIIMRIRAACHSRPRGAVSVVAVVATVISAYPVLLLDRTMISPNVGGTPMLYDQAPFAPGFSDTLVEEVRGSDVGAMMWQDLPDSEIQRSALSQREMPLWNRYNASGRPLWGQGLGFLLDPLHWLTFVTPDPTLGWDLKFVAHRFVFSLGTGLVALATTSSLTAAFLAAVSAPFVGVYTFRMNHPTALCLSYAPWVLLAWWQLIAAHDRRRRASAAILLAMSSALLIVASPPKEALLTLLGVEAAGAAAVLCSPGEWVERGRRLLAAVFAGIVAALMTTPHWLLFLEELRQSVTAYDAPVAEFAGHAQATGFVLGPLVESTLSPGLHLLAMVLFIAAVMDLRSLIARSSVFILACGLTGEILVAIGFGALPAAWLVKVPLIKGISHVGDSFPTAAVPLLLIVTAAGAGAMLNASRARAIAVTIGTALACWWLALDIPQLWAKGGLEPDVAVRLGLLPVAAAIPWCFRIAQRNAERLLPKVAAGGAAVALLLPGGLHAYSGVPQVDAVLVHPRPRGAILPGSPAIEAVHRASVEPARTIGLDQTLFPGTQALYQLEDIGGADPLEVPAYRELEDAAGMFHIWYWRMQLGGQDLPRLRPLLDMLNVEFLFARPDAVTPGLVEMRLPGPDRIRVLRRATAWPRAFFVDQVTTYTDAPDLLRQVKLKDTPMAAVQSSDRQATDATRTMRLGGGAMIRASDYHLTANTTTFTVQAPGAGIAVLSETDIPDDFRTTLNDQPVAYFRVNHAFKAVAIPSAGSWRVRFEYRPHHWDLSLLIAGFGFVLLGGLGVVAWRSSQAVDAPVNENFEARV